MKSEYLGKFILNMTLESMRSIYRVFNHREKAKYTSYLIPTSMLPIDYF